MPTVGGRTAGSLARAEGRRPPKYVGFFLPVHVLSRVFRGKFVEALRRVYDQHEPDLAGGTEHLRDPAQWRVFVDALFETDWVVYAKPALAVAAKAESLTHTPIWRVGATSSQLSARSRRAARAGTPPVSGAVRTA